MATSGVKVSDKVKELLNDMKVKKKDDDINKRMRIIVLHICKDIEVEKIYTEEDLSEKENVYKFLESLMEPEECKYIIYDCHYETKATKKEELVFIMWSCDKAKVGKKMPYASSKSCLKKILDFKHEFEFHAGEDKTPHAFADCLSKMAKSEITSLEGIDLSK